MPQAIILDRLINVDTGYRVCLWAAVPAAYQANRRNPRATSANPFATPAELQAIRDGAVAERVVSYVANAGEAQGTIDAALEAMCTAYQTEVSNWNSMSLCGRRWNGSGAWVASAGIPTAAMSAAESGDPGFLILTPVLALTANRLHFVLSNAMAATSQGIAARVRRLSWLPEQAAITGAAPSDLTIRRRVGATTMPAGGDLTATVLELDTAQLLPAGITVHTNPTTPPAGGAVKSANEFTPQADEQKLTTLDAPTMASLGEFGGVTLFDSRPAGPLVLRPAQTLEVVQGATAGAGNGRLLCLFTAG